MPEAVYHHHRCSWKPRYVVPRRSMATDMHEPHTLSGWTSWRDEWTVADVEKALAYVGLVGWTFDSWTDGDMQFMHKAVVPFDDLAKLRIAFTPLRMVVEAVVDQDTLDEQNLKHEKAGGTPLHREPTPLMVLVTMSWNEVSDPEAL